MELLKEKGFKVKRVGGKISLQYSEFNIKIKNNIQKFYTL